MHTYTGTAGVADFVIRIRIQHQPTSNAMVISDSGIFDADLIRLMWHDSAFRFL